MKYVVRIYNNAGEGWQVSVVIELSDGREVRLLAATPTFTKAGAKRLGRRTVRKAMRDAESIYDSKTPLKMTFEATR